MIEFLSDPSKKSLHDFKQGVLRRDLEIKDITKDQSAAEYTVIKTIQPHGLKVGDMVNVKAESNLTSGTEPYLFNDIALEVLALGDKQTDGKEMIKNKIHC